jgi:hypothetical protein
MAINSLFAVAFINRWIDTMFGIPEPVSGCAKLCHDFNDLIADWILEQKANL